LNPFLGAYPNPSFGAIGAAGRSPGARASVYQATKHANGDALRLFYRAVELDPNFASAYGMAAWCYA